MHPLLFLLLHLLFVALASALLGCVGWLLFSDFCSFNRSGSPPVEMVVEVSSEDTVDTVAGKLKAAGLIEYPWFFKLYANITNAEEKIGMGSHTLNTDMDYHALVLGMRSSAGNMTADTVQVTIPEGYTVAQTIAVLAKNGVNTEAALTEAAQKADFDYDFIDNEEFFSSGNPYTNLVDDIPKYCYFAKAALAALNYMDWTPDIIHCHDWQAALVPVYLRTQFANTKLTTAKTILTIHNLRFQGIYDIPTVRYWSGLPDYVFNKDALKTGYRDANMLKGGLTYSNSITTVSQTYAGEIQSPYYGETLDAHLRYHSGKLRGIVNGIDCDIWNPATDERLHANYDAASVLKRKKENKRQLQEELGLEQDDHKFVIGLISRLTDQKGLDLLNAILPHVMDEHTQVVVLGTGDRVYEDSFRYYEDAYRGNVCSSIMYDETRAHRIYAGADALLVPSRFEPCGLTQLIAMRYGTVPIVRETGGLKDTVEPYNMYTNAGNGFTFDRYDAGLLLDAINRAKTLYFEARACWDDMVRRDMDKDVSWESSAKQYKDLYLELTW